MSPLSAPKGGLVPCTKRVMNLAHLLRQAARRFPQEIGFVHGPTETTWAQMDARVDAMAAALVKRGIGKGDRILVQSKNCLEMFESMFAAFRIGAVWVPTNFRQTPDEVAYLAQASGAIAMICHADFPEHVAVVRAQSPAIGFVIGIGTADFGEEYNALVASHLGEKVPVADVEHDDPCWFFFTSGTTGRPKAAVLTHGQMGFVITNHLCDLMPGTTHEDASLVVAPLSHGAGVHQLVQVARAAKTILLPSEKFDVAEAWRLVEHWRVTNLFTVPTITKLLAEHPSVDSFDHSSLRYVIYAGAPMYREDQKRALAKLGKVLVQYFGLGEVTGNITVLPPALHEPEDGPHVKLGTCGFERTGMMVQIQDDTGREVAPFETGEICVAGLAVFAGYYNNPDANAKAFPQWLVPHRRSRPHGRRRLRLHHRARLRHVHFGRLQRLSARGGGKGAPASGHRGGGHSRRARPHVGRGGGGGVRRPAGRADEREGHHRVPGRQGVPLQAAQARLLLGGAAQVRLRQDHQEDGARGIGSPRCASPRKRQGAGGLNRPPQIISKGETRV